jgi:hypothetical protein
MLPQIKYNSHCWNYWDIRLVFKAQYLLYIYSLLSYFFNFHASIVTPQEYCLLGLFRKASRVDPKR